MDWDLTSWFDSFGSPTQRGFSEALVSDLRNLGEDLDDLPSLSNESFPQWEELLRRQEEWTARFSHLNSYLSCLTAADAQREDYQVAESALAELECEYQRFEARLIRKLGSADEVTWQQFQRSDAFSGMEQQLWEWRQKATCLLGPQEEDLLAQMELNALKAWSQLYFRISGNLRFRYELPDGTQQEALMSQRNSLLSHPDARVRKSAFMGANQAWKCQQISAAAALNAMGGTRLLLDGKRRRHFLDEACRAARIQHSTLDALLTALEEKRDFSRQFVQAKTRALHLPALSWWDLHAPVSRAYACFTSLSWKEGCNLVQSAFNRHYPAMGSFFHETLQRRWFDYQARPGKRPGGFCTTSRLKRESRIFMTYEGDMSAVMTLAHEVGHAWHGRVLSSLRVHATRYPMTLAESASTFAEMVLLEDLLHDSDVSGPVRDALLDADLTRALIFLLDIPVRFHFEKKFHEERADSFVTPARLCKIMEETQRDVFGDFLTKDGTDPLFWANKLHFFIDDIRFYNFPYTFGYLLSQELFRRFRAEGPAFLKSYERFLSLSGSRTCEEAVSESIGENISEASFWSSAIEATQPVLNRFQAVFPAAGKH